MDLPKYVSGPSQNTDITVIIHDSNDSVAFQEESKTSNDFILN